MAPENEETRQEKQSRMARAREDAANKRVAEDRKLRASVDAVLRTEAGREVFKFLFHLCGWVQADVPLDHDGRVNEGTLIHNATRRFVYARIRAKASRALLEPAEAAAEALTLLDEINPEEKP